MGLWDTVKDVVSSVTGGSGSSTSWVSGAISVGGMLMDYFATEDEKDAISGAADRQEAEYMRVALANKAISEYDARVARDIGLTRRFEADMKAGLMYNNLQKILGQQRVSYAKSGVALKMGTPVDVMEETTKRGARDIMNVKYEGTSAKAAADSLAARYKLLGEKGLRDGAALSSMIQDAASDREDAADWGFRQDSLKTAYEWFK